LKAESRAPDLSFATLEPKPEITDRVVAALPRPDVKLDAACAPVKYTRRTLKDGDVYFFFNESNQTQIRTATLAGNGVVQVWDATRGTIQPLAGVANATGSVAVPLTLAPQESRFIVIGALPTGAAGTAPNVAASQVIAEFGDAWSVTLGDKQVTSALKPWRDLGVDSFTGTAIYKRELTVAAPPTGKRVYLDLGDVREDARVRLNGTDLEVRSWPPYLWDVTSALKPGANSLEVQVRTAPANAGRGFGGGQRPGVPGGLGGDAVGGRGGRGGPGGAGGGAPGGRGGAPGAPAPTPTVAGLLGPVRLLAQ
jgi:hypothetical protein